MCGINVTINGSLDQIQMMQKATFRRGTQNFIHQIGNIIVSFDWLAITDSNAKPFFKVGKYTVFLNGFISNHKELKEKYGFITETDSDTEVLAHFLDKFGMYELSELNGFFSIFCIVERKQQGLEPMTCYFTDRYGIKQLYRYTKNGANYISSEVKGILALDDEFELDKESVDDWKYSLGVMTKNTIYKNIYRVDKLPFVRPKKIKIDYETAKQKLLEFWTKSVQRNKVKNLNDGVFLSGGIDSGIISKYFNPDYSFSMDYLDENLSEIENIKLNSAGIHYSMICNDDLIEKYKIKCLTALDDLKAGSSYTNFALTELASKFCTVLYSGAGGDEVFGGYPHRNEKNIQDVIKRNDFDFINYPEISHDEYNWIFLDAVLVVEDRMAGFHTMETRYPLLDNDFVYFALSLPNEYLKDKKILKDISGLDEKILNSPKKGFSNPTDNNEWVNFCLNNKL